MGRRSGSFLEKRKEDFYQFLLYKKSPLGNILKAHTLGKSQLCEASSQISIRTIPNMSRSLLYSHGVFH